MNELDRVNRRLSLHDLRVFMSVVQARSMGKAAIRLATSQPAVSRSIANLETAFGVVLLDRSPRGIEPTAYGSALFRRGLAVFDEIMQGIKDIQFIADPTAGELRIGASIAVAVGFISSIIDRLSKRHPRLSFQVLATDTTTAYRALAERQVDLLVAHITEPILDEHFDADVLFHDPHVVVAGVRSPWARRRRLALGDLMNEPWALPPPDAPYGAVVLEAFRAAGLGVPRTVVTSTLPLRGALVATGHFLSMVPRVVLHFQGRNRAFKGLSIDLPSTHRPLAIVTLKNRPLNPVGGLFAECAREAAKPLAMEGIALGEK